MFFFISIFVQLILGYSPVKTGLSFLPVTLVIGLTATITSRFIARIGYKPFMVVAPLFIAAALYYLSFLTVSSTYLVGILPGISLLALGAGMSFVAISVAATSGVPQRESGLASGLLNTAQQIGGALGLAVLSGIAASRTKEFIVAAGAQAADPLTRAMATVAGFRSALEIGATFAVAASIIALVMIRTVPVSVPGNEPAPADAPLPIPTI